VARARGVGTLDRERDLFWGEWSVHALLLDNPYHFWFLNFRLLINLPSNHSI
jgi:hypothetical protein